MLHRLAEILLILSLTTVLTLLGLLAYLVVLSTKERSAQFFPELLGYLTAPLAYVTLYWFGEGSIALGVFYSFLVVLIATDAFLWRHLRATRYPDHGPTLNQIIGRAVAIWTLRRIARR